MGSIMKKVLIILLCIVGVFSLVSCSNDKNTSTNEGSSISSETEENQTKNKDQSKKAEVKNKDIEKVILSINGEESTTDYDADAEKLIEEIRKCKDKPETALVEKVGKISIKNKGNDEIVDIADFYIAADYSVYAKLIDNADNDYAYKIDTSIFDE